MAFVASLPVKLPHIKSEDLEHFDDKSLDAQFHRKLEILDEDRRPIQGAGEWIRRAIGHSQAKDIHVPARNGSAAAPARAPLNIQIPDFTEERSESELPYPGQNASDDEFIAYANSNPAVKLLQRVFRARITGVVRKSELS